MSAFRIAGVYVSNVEYAERPSLASILDSWADTAEAEATQALDDDNLGRTARLRGKAEGLRMAAAEIRREAAEKP